METNFFHQVAALQLQGDLNITIKQVAENSLLVSVLLNNSNCKDAAAKTIPPIILKGTAYELDEGFFAGIAAPVQVSSQLIVNMEAYAKAQEKAQKDSKSEKDRTNKAVSQKNDKETKLEAALKVAEELEKQGKYKEAWIKVPEPSDYPEHAEMLRNRREELTAHFAPSLFNS